MPPFISPHHFSKIPGFCLGEPFTLLLAMQFLGVPSHPRRQTAPRLATRFGRRDAPSPRGSG